jgi:hypothetical protein
MQRQAAQIVTLKRQDVEGIELHLVIMSARVQAVEIGDAVDTQEQRLAIDDEGRGPVLQRRLNDQRIAISPIIAVARE